MVQIPPPLLIYMTKDIAIVYMVAGISSRFGGKIKQFVEVGKNDETLIECSLDQALSAGFTKIIFIVGNKTEQPFKEKFGENYKGIPITYVLQKYDLETRDRPWGTSDALCTIQKIIDCPFVVCNGDDLYGRDSFKTLVNHLENYDDEATLGYKLINVLPEKGKTNRGIFRVNENGYVQNLEEVFDIEKLDLDKSDVKPDDFCSMNIFALHPKTVDLLCYRLGEFKKNREGDRNTECLIPNEISQLVKAKEIKMKIYPSTDKWIGVTNPGDEEIVREKLRLG